MELTKQISHEKFKDTSKINLITLNDFKTSEVFALKNGGIWIPMYISVKGKRVYVSATLQLKEEIEFSITPNDSISQVYEFNLTRDSEIRYAGFVNGKEGCFFLDTKNGNGIGLSTDNTKTCMEWISKLNRCIASKTNALISPKTKQPPDSKLVHLRNKNSSNSVLLVLPKRTRLDTKQLKQSTGTAPPPAPKLSPRKLQINPSTTKTAVIFRKRRYTVASAATTTPKTSTNRNSIDTCSTSTSQTGIEEEQHYDKMLKTSSNSASTYHDLQQSDIESIMETDYTSEGSFDLVPELLLPESVVTASSRSTSVSSSPEESSFRRSLSFNEVLIPNDAIQTKCSSAGVSLLSQGRHHASYDCHYSHYTNHHNDPTFVSTTKPKSMTSFSRNDGLYKYKMAHLAATTRTHRGASTSRKTLLVDQEHQNSVIPSLNNQHYTNHYYQTNQHIPLNYRQRLHSAPHMHATAINSCRNNFVLFPDDHHHHNNKQYYYKEANYHYRSSLSTRRTGLDSNHEESDVVELVADNHSAMNITDKTTITNDDNNNNSRPTNSASRSSSRLKRSDDILSKEHENPSNLDYVIVKRNHMSTITIPTTATTESFDTNTNNSKNNYGDNMSITKSKKITVFQKMKQWVSKLLPIPRRLRKQ